MLINFWVFVGSRLWTGSGWKGLTMALKAKKELAESEVA